MEGRLYCLMSMTNYNKSKLYIHTNSVQTQFDLIKYYLWTIIKFRNDSIMTQLTQQNQKSIHFKLNLIKLTTKLNSQNGPLSLIMNYTMDKTENCRNCWAATQQCSCLSLYWSGVCVLLSTHLSTHQTRSMYHLALSCQACSYHCCLED